MAFNNKLLILGMKILLFIILLLTLNTAKAQFAPGDFDPEHYYYIKSDAFGVANVLLEPLSGQRVEFMINSLEKMGVNTPYLYTYNIYTKLRARLTNDNPYQSFDIFVYCDNDYFEGPSNNFEVSNLSVSIVDYAYKSGLHGNSCPLNCASEQMVFPVGNIVELNSSEQLLLGNIQYYKGGHKIPLTLAEGGYIDITLKWTLLCNKLNLYDPGYYFRDAIFVGKLHNIVSGWIAVPKK